MKKGLSLILVLVMCLCLCACGKSDAVKNVESMLKQVGPVTEENLEEVYAVVNAYDALSREEQEQVKKYDNLMEELDAWLTAEIPGKWTQEPKHLYNVDEMYDKVDLTLNEDGTAENNFVTGPWYVEDGVVKIQNGKSNHIYYTYYEDGQLSLGSASNLLIPQEKFRSMMDDILVEVELTPENIGEYCQIKVYTEQVMDDFGVLTGDTRTYAVLDSKKRADGLIYLESSDDLAIELIIPEHTYRYQSKNRAWRDGVEEEDTYTIKNTPFGRYGGSLGSKDVKNEYEKIHDITADQISFGRVAGKIVFLREEYVSEVKKDDDSISRIIVLKNGEEIHSSTWREGMDY